MAATKRAGWLVLICLTLSAALTAAAPPGSPVVEMAITPPDGHTKTLSAVESGVVAVKLANGEEFEFRPTIQDSQPWNHVMVTIFRAATATQPTQVLGQVQLETGGAAVVSKTKPAFKIAVTKVGPPAS